MEQDAKQRSFISEKLAAELELEVTGRKVLNVAGFGSKKTEVRHLDKVHLTIIGEGNQYLPVELLVVPQIGVPIQTHSGEIKRLPHLRHLKLAHPNPSDQPFDIQILIGADYYWDFILGHVVRGKGPTAVKSKLGYLLSGPIQETNKKKNTEKTGSKDEELRNVAFCRPTSSQQKSRQKRTHSKEDLKKQKNKDKPVTSLDPFNQMNTEKSKELSGEVEKVPIPVVSLMNKAEPCRVYPPKVYRDHQTSSLVGGPRKHYRPHSRRPYQRTPKHKCLECPETEKHDIYRRSLCSPYPNLRNYSWRERSPSRIKHSSNHTIEDDPPSRSPFRSLSSKLGHSRYATNTLTIELSKM
jgi:hypothetical protein